MAPQHSKKKINTVVVIVISITIIIIIMRIVQSLPRDTGVMCTLDAKICADGTYVGRAGPSCEFTECPKFVVATVDTSDWNTAIDKSGVTFKYPRKLSTTYIKTSDWPPKVQVIEGPFSCTDAGEPNARAGHTETKTINGHEYCITTVEEGAAGSTFTQYAYEREINGHILYFTFTLRAPQCANYNEPEKSICETEKTTFDINSLMDTVIQTTTI